jgi:hypothetical protein
VLLTTMVEIKLCRIIWCVLALSSSLDNACILVRSRLAPIDFSHFTFLFPHWNWMLAIQNIISTLQFIFIFIFYSVILLLVAIVFFTFIVFNWILFSISSLIVWFCYFFYQVWSLFF